MNFKTLATLGGAVALLTLTACPDPCLDDGLLQDDPAGCAAADGTDGGSATDSEDSQTDTLTEGDTCANGVLDPGEADVDCGGTCPNACGDGDGCGVDSDCASAMCREGVCVDPNCSNGMLDGDETDVDCGGSCEGCDDGETCENDDDCLSMDCGDDGTCQGGGSTCDDGAQNGDETDVDCGGDTCDPCDDGQTCVDPDDCTSEICEDGECAAPSCDDGVQNGDETDVDCGGPDCAGCPCEGPDDCPSGVCGDDGLCADPTCDDGVQNGDETDLDCGGSCGSTCVPGEMCEVATDCTTFSCDPDDGTCNPAGCMDGAHNGDETDVDCGGPTCPACDVPGFCDVDEDCQTLTCALGECVPPSCDNGIPDGNETSIDCGGGTCPACDPGLNCDAGVDCLSGICDKDGCAAPSCDDGVQNGDETDVDCGGSCEGCDNTQDCLEDDDCASTSCDPTAGVCVGPQCDDGQQNDDETDVDCGGEDCAPCDDGLTCEDNGDCASVLCDDDTCVTSTCDDGVSNGDETDVDCGGPDCDPCETGDDCVLAFDCESLVCLGDECQAARCDDGVQNQDETDVDCGGDICGPCNNGDGCIDDDDCVNDDCQGMICQGPTCDDNMQNGDESDVDCGGTVCEPCGVGEGCNDPTDCDSLLCNPIDNVCLIGTCLDNVQNQDETDVDCGGLLCGPCGPGDGCEDDDDCSTGGCTDNECNAALSVVAAPECSDAAGGPVTINAVATGGTGNYTYAWTPDDGSLTTPDMASTDADPSGVQQYTVTVDDGNATAMAGALVVDTDPLQLFGGCTLFTADYDAGDGSAASITYDMDGTRACEEGNNEFGLHLCSDTVFSNNRLTGTVEVEDNANDNDWIGLVWGAQDSSNFYSLVWKQEPQNFFGCTTPAGILVKRIEADSFANLTGADFYCPQDTPNSTVLALPAATTTEGWLEALSYDVVIDYTPTQSAITVTRNADSQNVASFTINDATFPSGAFGSTTLSQANACVGPLFAECL